MRSAEGRPELRKEEAVELEMLQPDTEDPRVGREPDEPLELGDKVGRRVGTRRPIEGGAPRKMISLPMLESMLNEATVVKSPETFTGVSGWTGDSLPTTLMGGGISLELLGVEYEREKTMSRGMWVVDWGRGIKEKLALYPSAGWLQG